MDHRKHLLNSFNAAIAAADPLRIVPRHLPLPLKLPKGRTLVTGAGKAAAAMALAVENHWQRNAVMNGIVLTRYGHGVPLERIKVIEAGHPLPDAHGEQAAQDILGEVKKTRCGRFPAMPGERRRVQSIIVAGGRGIAE